MTTIVVPFDRRRRGAVPLPAIPAPVYPARVARQLALAHALQRRVASGEFKDLAATASGLDFSRARITQLFDLLLLAPDIQEDILFLECPPGAQPFHEAALRPIVRLLVWREQRRAWAALRRGFAARSPIRATP